MPVTLARTAALTWGGVGFMLTVLALLAVWVGMCSGTLLELTVLPVSIAVRRFGVVRLRVDLRGVVADFGGAFAGVDAGDAVVGVTRFDLDQDLGTGGRRSLPILEYGR